MTSAYVRPDTAAFLAFLNAQPGPKMQDVDPAMARMMMKALKAIADVETGAIAVNRSLACPGPSGDIGLRLFDARETRLPGPCVLFIHGGGFVVGDLDTYEPFCAEMARQIDLPVVSVDYRLAPEARWPAAPDDCEAVARWIATGPADLGRAVTALALAGDSAGGNLAIVTAMALRDRPAAVPVIAQLPIYPVTDSSRQWPSRREFAEGHFLTAEGMAWFDGHYAPDPADPRASPLLGDQHGMPATLVVTASLDPLRDEGRAYAARLVEAGVPTIFREAVGTIHGFIQLRKAIPSANGDVAAMLNQFRSIIIEAEADRVIRQAAGAA